MIQKKDLRICNKLQYFIGEGGCEWEETVIDWQDLKWISENPENFNKVHKGIPLTEDLLIKLGAVVRGIKDIKTFNLNGCRITLKNGLWIEYVHQIELPYLHTLQNFFYFTRGEELKTDSTNL